MTAAEADLAQVAAERDEARREIERLKAALERIGSSLTPLEDRDVLARRARQALARQ
jgi:cell division protein FtsB